VWSCVAVRTSVFSLQCSSGLLVRSGCTRRAKSNILPVLTEAIQHLLERSQIQLPLMLGRVETHLYKDARFFYG
jgi:hypothetical protein